MIVVIGFYAGGIFCNRAEKSAYQQHRSDILRLAERDNLNRYQLIAVIDDDYDLQNVAEWLKKDGFENSGRRRTEV